MDPKCFSGLYKVFVRSSLFWMSTALIISEAHIRKHASSHILISAAYFFINSFTLDLLWHFVTPSLRHLKSYISKTNLLTMTISFPYIFFRFFKQTCLNTPNPFHILFSYVYCKKNEYIKFHMYTNYTYTC